MIKLLQKRIDRLESTISGGGGGAVSKPGGEPKKPTRAAKPGEGEQPIEAGQPAKKKRRRRKKKPGGGQVVGEGGSGQEPRQSATAYLDNETVEQRQSRMTRMDNYKPYRPKPKPEGDESGESGEDNPKTTLKRRRKSFAKK
jgi:hypothetical protein